MASADHWDWNSLQISKDVKERRNRERELERERENGDQNGLDKLGDCKN